MYLLKHLKSKRNETLDRLLKVCEGFFLYKLTEGFEQMYTTSLLSRIDKVLDFLSLEMNPVITRW